MKNNGSVKGYITDATVPYKIPQGYHDGAGTVDIDAEQGYNYLASVTVAAIPVSQVENSQGGYTLTVG